MRRKPQQPPSEIVRRRARREAHAALEALRKPPKVATSPRARQRAKAVVDKPHLLAALLGASLPKVKRVTSPTWLAVVRLMPCAFCGHDPAWTFRLSLSVLRPQSECNHYPGRGRAGGGSDLEVHPACSACHRKITEHLISDLEQADAVARTQWQIVAAIGLGWLLPEFLVQVGAEISAV